MLSIEAALARVLARVPPVRHERVELARALGRVVVEDVVSTVELPGWPGSAMDGYAVRAADVPGTLHVVEEIAAGSSPTRVIGLGQAARIMTGAPVPDGADAVVMVEDTQTDGGLVTVRVGASVGLHIRPRGSEVPRGCVVLRRGQILSPGAIGVCASVGVPSVRVSMRPRVGILSTGDEIVEPGFPLGPAQIWSSNSLALAGQVLQAGAVPVQLGNVSDDRESLRAAFLASAGCDVVLSTGGVSVGDFDYVKEVWAELGVPMDFWRIAMKPGKPLAFGWMGETPLFGLPGNPVSCMVNFLQFVRPMLRTMLGDPTPFLPVVEAVIDTPWSRRAGRPELVRVRLSWSNGAFHASILAGQGSAHLRGMSEGHGFVLVEADATTVRDRVRVQVFDTSFLAGATSDYGLRTFASGDSVDAC